MLAGKVARWMGMACAGLMATAGLVRGQAVGGDMMPRIVEKDGRHALLVDGQPYFMLGAQVHNSSTWPGMFPRVWPALEFMHVNTAEFPVYWEQIEAAAGKYDFSVVDELLKQAREHKMRLVILWFGTWKNGSNHYMPEWMKKDAVKYPNIQARNGSFVDSPSPHTTAAMDLDAKAFAAFMGHLKEADPQHTVIMVQVENEPGAWGGVRDYSAAAEKIFAGPVPAELLKPEVFQAMRKPGPVAAAGSNWQTAFGDDADEFFQAYAVAHYIGQVAAAGKAVNPLPMYINVALRDPLNPPRANSYESGGATDNVIPIYKIAAPAVDVLAPDIYLSDSARYFKLLELYGRPDNMLMVPETGSGDSYARYVFSVLGHSGAGFSPFGVDDNGRAGATPEENLSRLTALSRYYAALTPMMREVARWSFEGKIKAAVEREDHAEQTLDLGTWQAVVTFGGNQGRGGGGRGGATTQATVPAVGECMVAQLGESEFIVVASSSHITFRLAAEPRRAWQYLKVEEGNYENGKFKALRILNGDETDGGGPRFGAAPEVLHVTLVAR